MKGKGICGPLTPLENLKHCCVSKPPIVLFTIGLCILALAFVSLALYVKDNNEIVDPNYRIDWGTFLKDLTKYEWMNPYDCLKEDIKDLPHKKGNFTNQISIEVTVLKEVAFHLAEDQLYQAVMWKESLLPKDEPKKKTFVSVFSFSHIKQNSSLTANSDVSSQKGGDANSLSLCMTISSYNSEPFLKRKLVKPTSCEPAVTQYIPDDKILPIYPCDHKDVGSLFQTVYQEANSLKMYLTSVDRENIHIHLMSTSYFLFVVVVTIFLYGLMKCKTHVVTEASTQLLP